MNRRCESVAGRVQCDLETGHGGQHMHSYPPDPSGLITIAHWIAIVHASPTPANTQNMSDMAQYCPTCGAGPNGDGTFRMPKTFPFNGPCDECNRRAYASFYALGEAWERKRTEMFWKAFLERTDPVADEPITVPASTPPAA